MELSGLNLRISIAGQDVLRCPRWWIDSQRTAVVQRAGLALPDPDGAIYRTLKKADPVTIRVGYRDQSPAEWTGTVDWFGPGATRDQIAVNLVDPSAPLARVRMTQTLVNEPPEAIMAWAIRQAGLPVGRIDATGMVLPRFVASDCNAGGVARQLAATCQNAFDLDMSTWKLWLGRDGVNWGPFDEPGDVPVIATGAGLISHEPPGGAYSLGQVETFLLPDLRHSRRFRLVDVRRGIDAEFRALRVRHQGTPTAVRTLILYGDEHA